MLKKILSYLSHLGSGCIFMAFAWVLIAEGCLRIAHFAPSRYLIIIGFLIQLPFSCYKMWHWEEYKNENRFNSVFIHVLLAALLILALIIFEKKGL